MRLIIENVRSFVGRHEIPIKPLTILTGENSSGKTTVLACLAAITDPVGFPLKPNFDASPYNLGSYDTIASNKGGSSGVAKSFSIGWMDGPGESQALATYDGLGGVPRLTSFQTRSVSGTISMKWGESRKSYRVSHRRTGDSKAADFSLRDVWPNEAFASALTRSLTKESRHDSGSNGSPYAITGPYVGLAQLEGTASIAPIRAHPERTYNAGAFSYRPDGGHTPHVLARLTGPGYAQAWKDVQRDFEKFGAESDLFRDIRVRHLGRAGADPFQIQVKIGGAWINWTDVGYGVSQVLPVVAESLFFSGPSALLIQQPELHLHGKAQAALGSFFAGIVEKRQSAAPQINFAIETHSDYLVDRVRMEIAAGTVDHTSVAMLYVEKKGRGATVYALNLDSVGNILDAPPSYRHFFLTEELALLSRAN